MLTSTSNPLVKDTVNLVKKPKARQDTDVFVVEGPKMVAELPRERFIRGFVTERFLAENGDSCIKGLSMELVSERVMEVMSDTKTPQGILAVVRQYHYGREELLSGAKKPLFLCLERLSDPGNLGTMIRAGEGAGLSGIFMSRDCVDVYNPKVIRATMGSIYRVPFLYVDSMEETADWLRGHEVLCFAAHLKESCDYDQADYRGPAAFFIGNEARGLSDALTERADRCVKIPMLGKVESLNAAVAASLLMYEAARQRRALPLAPF